MDSETVSFKITVTNKERILHAKKLWHMDFKQSFFGKNYNNLIVVSIASIFFVWFLKLSGYILLNVESVIISYITGFFLISFGIWLYCLKHRNKYLKQEKLLQGRNQDPESYTVIFKDDGVGISTDDSTSVIKWSYYNEVFISGEAIYLVDKSFNYHLIPTKEIPENKLEFVKDMVRLRIEKVNEIQND